jgi:transcription-repair coupling factor (superfamily II helicase)
VINLFLNSQKLLALEHALQQGDNILIESLWNSPKALIAALAQKATGKHVLILTGASQEEVKLFHDFPLFTDRPVVDFPAWETLPSENVPPSPDIVGDRYKVLNEISSGSSPHIILSSLQACLQKLIPPAKFSSLYFSLKVGDVVSYDSLTQRLTEMGYRKTAMASEKGEFADRKSVV